MLPSGANRSMSLTRALRTGPTMSGICVENTAARRVRPHSTGSTYTMSAFVSPRCGWAFGVLSSLTTMTGVPTPPSRPLNGDVVGAMGSGSGVEAAGEGVDGVDVSGVSGARCSGPHAASTSPRPTTAAIRRMASG